MKNNEQVMFDFLVEINRADLAERFKGVVSTTPISLLSLNNLSEDILSEFFARLIRLSRPENMLLMEFDAKMTRALNQLQKPEHPSSIDAWLRTIKMHYIDFYREVKG